MPIASAAPRVPAVATKLGPKSVHEGLRLCLPAQKFEEHAL
jgi:hypothetical protein